MIYKHHYHCHPYQLINYHCHFYHVNNYHPLNNHRSQARDCTTCYPEHRLYVSTCVSNCPEGSRPSTQVLPLIQRSFQKGTHFHKKNGDQKQPFSLPDPHLPCLSSCLQLVRRRGKVKLQNRKTNHTKQSDLCSSTNPPRCTGCKPGYHLLPDLGTCVTTCRSPGF